MADHQDQSDGLVEGICKPCQRKDIETKADVLCISCDEFQCLECSNVHKLYGFMKDHTLIDAAGGHAQKCLKKLDIKGLDMCNKHGKQLEYFCEDDKTVCCCTCVVIEHRSCKTLKEIKELANEECLTNIRNDLYAAVALITETKDNLQVAEETLTTSIDKVKSGVLNIKREVIKLFDEFEESMNECLDIYRDTKQAEWKEKADECTSKITDVKHVLVDIDNVYQYGTACQKFVMENLQRVELSGLVQTEKAFCKTLETIGIHSSFQCQCAQMKHKIANLLDHRNLDMNQIIPQKVKLAFTKSIDLLSNTNVTQSPLYSGMTFLDEERLLVVDNANTKCVLFNTDLEMLATYEFKFSHPQCVTRVAGDTVAVTSGREVDFLHINADNTIEHLKTLDTTTKFSSISNKDDSTFLVSAYKYKKPFRMLTHDGIENDFDLNIADIRYTFGQSCCAYAKASDKIVMSDRDNNAVYIFETVSNTYIKVTGELIRSPQGVAIGPRNHIFVCNTDANCIVEITETGRVVSAHRISLARPRYLCISDDGNKLAVVEISNESRKLQVYKIQTETGELNLDHKD